MAISRSKVGRKRKWSRRGGEDEGVEGVEE
jgi:hypothetical protein